MKKIKQLQRMIKSGVMDLDHIIDTFGSLDHLLTVSPELNMTDKTMSIFKIHHQITKNYEVI